MHSNDPNKSSRRLGWADLSLRVKGVVVVSLPLGVLLLNSACTYLLDAQQQKAQQWVMHTLHIRVAIERLLTEYIQTNTACRTYSLSREASLLPECRGSGAQLNSTLDEIQALTSDNRSQTRRIQELRPILEQRLQRLLTITPQGITQDPRIALNSQRQVLRLVNAMDAEEARLLLTRATKLSNIHRLFSAVVPFTLLFGIAGGLAGTWLFLTGVVRRMALIGEQVAIVADGVPVAVVDLHRDEIGKVAEGVARTSQLLAERNAALSETHQQLVEQSERAKQANAAKSDFLARMSHEIRTPLNAISGMADLLLETPLNEQQDQYVRIFRNNSERLLTLINDILDLSKVESGHLELERLPFDLTAVLDKTMDLLAPLADRKGLELIADVAQDLRTGFCGDADRLQQILVNLIGNAIKFTQTGEVVVAVEKDPDSPGSGCLRFRVSDTGIGINAKDLGGVFEPFVQADSSITRKAAGTGLGLAITKRLVELMGGRIWAESHIEVGSTFCFTVNLELQSKPRSSNPASYHEFSNLRALVVDDNATNRLLLRRLLEQWHVQVDETESGSQALRCLRQQGDRHDGYNVVLLDRRMPGMDGFDTAEQICNHAEFRSPVVLMLASDTQAGDLARARQMGIHATLIKPIKSAKLASALQDALGANTREPSGGTERVPSTNHEKRGSIRILLAEDTEDNRFLISAYLEPEGYQITMVENGAAAVESAIAHRYDLILMDVQMPIKDGYTATGEIRAWESQQQLSPVPIIALTAHALKGEEARAEEAGCSAYLAKPISKAKLTVAMEAQLRKTSLKSAEFQPQRPLLAPEIQARVPTYLARRRQEVQVIRGLIEQNDFERIRVLAHNMKGSGAGYGFPEISKLGAEIERAAKAQQTADLDQQTKSLEAFLAVFDTQAVTFS